jgi:hypothetical protein
MKELIEKFSVFGSQEFLFLGIVAVIFFDLLYFLFGFFRTRSLKKNSVKTSATISEVKEVDGVNGKYQELTLIFKDEAGIEFAPIFENMFKPRQRGERVDIYYVKSDPSNVVLDDWRSLHMKNFISFFALVSTVMIGYFLLQQGLMRIPYELLR